MKIEILTTKTQAISIFCKNHSSLLGHNCPSQKANTLEDLPQKVAKVENQKEVSICNLDQCDQIVVTTCPRFLDSDLKI